MYIYYRYLTGRLTVVYIYRRNESQTRIFIMPRKGSFPGKRVFLGGLYLRENRAWKAFGASALNECELLTMHILKKSNAGLATWKDNGSIEKKHRQLYTTVILPGRLTVVYKYRRNESQTTIFIMPRKGSFPGKRVFLGGLYLRESGAESFWGKCLKRM